MTCDTNLLLKQNHFYGVGECNAVITQKSLDFTFSFHPTNRLVNGLLDRNMFWRNPFIISLRMTVKKK